MNSNTPRPGYLFFTPRTPWGTRAGQQTFRQHQRASEDARADADEKHLLWGKEQQGLGAQMATEKSPWRNGAERTLDKQGVPRSLSGQLPPPAQPTNAASQVPYTELQPFKPQPVPQRPPPTAQQLATQPPLASTQQQWRSAQPVTLPQDEGDDARHWSGSAGSRGGRHPKDEPDDAHVELHYDTNPRVREAEERRRQEEKKISPKNPWEEEEQQDDR